MNQRKTVKKLVSGTGKWVVVLLLLSVLLVQQTVYAAAGNITGTVFRDYNADGVKQPLEPGIAGVNVTAYDANGTPSPTAITIANGTYTIAHTFAGDEARVEFTLPSDGSLNYLQPGAAGNTTVQFIDISGGNVSGINVGFNNPAQYSIANPDVAVPAWERNDPTGNNNPVVRGHLYNANGTAVTLQNYANASQVGTIYGLAYQAQSDVLFGSTYIRRGAGVGATNTTGAIYKLSGTGAPSAFIDLTSMVTTGANPHPNGGTPNWITDPLTYPLVGKIGLGDLEISDDENTLYTVNLNERELVIMPLTFDGSGQPIAPGSGSVSTVTIPVPTDCDDNGTNPNEPDASDWRPFALKYFDGKLYVGGVCTAQSMVAGLDPATATFVTNIAPLLQYLDAHVYEFNPQTNTFNTTPILSVPLNYAREAVNDGAASQANDAEWQPWTDAWRPNWSATFGAIRAVPQPMLTDIEFDGRGFMFLGFRDRFSDQAYDGADPGPNNLAGTNQRFGGDLLLACLDAGNNWQLESGVVASRTCTNGLTGETRQATNPPSDDANPGSPQPEFFHNDQYLPGGIAPAQYHDETFLGSLAVSYGSGQLVGTKYDVFDAFEGGTITYDTANGDRLRAVQIYPATTRFGKAGGLGDVELLNDPAPIELGNRIWNDTDGDGIQDPGELPIESVTVNLYTDPDGIPNSGDETLVGTDTTDASGNYLFGGVPNQNMTGGNSVNRNTNYLIAVEGSQIAVNGLGLSPANAPQPANNNASDSSNDPITDIADSDAFVMPTGNGGSLTEDFQISLTTGGAGFNNHGFDVGLRPVVSLGSFVWNDTNSDGVQDASEPGIAGATVILLNSSGIQVTTDANGNDISAGITTTTNGFYSFSNLLPGDYIIQVTPPASYNYTPANQVGGAINASTTTNIDNTDSNIDATNTAAAPAGSYRSGTITLVAGSEPTGETLVGGANDDPNGVNGGSNSGVADANGNMTVDFAFEAPLVAMGSTIWVDTNGDGIQDSSENGLAGATVYLVDSSGNQVTMDALGNDISAGITTGVNGTYVFENLLPNDYYVEVSFPGYAPSNNQNGNAVDNTDSGNENVSNTDSNINTNATATVGDYRSGLITLTPNNEPIDEAQVCCGGSGVAGSDNPNNVNSANDDDANMTVDFGVIPVVALGSTVWLDVDNDGVQDSNESGLAGATVYLLDSGGNAVTDVNGVAVAPFITLADGYYYFDNLAPGAYYVEVQLPTGYIISTNQNGNAVNNSSAGNENVSNTDSNINTGATATAGDYRSGLITLTHDGEPVGETQAINGGAADNPGGVNSASDNDANMTVDFGITGGSISNYVWNDQNGDGVQDATESGIAGVTVWVDLNNDGVQDPGEPGDVTDANGGYYIGGLPAGNYTVRTDATVGSPINGAIPTYDLDGTGTANVAVVPLAAGENRTDVDWGYQFAALSITKTSDATGTVNPGDTIEYTLVVRNNTASQHTGIVISDTLPTGTLYVLNSTVAVGYVGNSGTAYYRDNFDAQSYGNNNGTAGWNWTGDWIEVGENNGPTTNNISIFDDGTVASGREYVLRILKPLNIDPPYLGIYRQANLTTCTNAVLSFDYRRDDTEEDILVEASTSAATGYATVFTIPANGNGTDANYIASGILTLIPIPVLQFISGLAKILLEIPSMPFILIMCKFPVVIKRTTAVMLDNDPGSANSALADGVPANLVLAADGFVLNPNQEMTVRFSVRVNDPVLGGLTSIDNTASVASTQQLTPREATHSDPLALANLGDRVWYDTNNNGLQDGGEVGVSGVVVNLYDPGLDGSVGGGDDIFVATTTTDRNGNYAFNNIVADTYFVDFDLPTGYSFTTQNVGGDDSIDGDADPVTGQTGLIPLLEGTTDNTIDAGLANSQLDYGDLPNSYNNTILGDDGPRHIVSNVLFLGLAVDTDPEGQENNTATGDTNDDGIQLDPNQLWNGVTPITIDVTVAGGPGVLGAWFDLNQDGDFADPGEFVNVGPVLQGTQTVALGTLDARNATINARFRLFPTGSSLVAGDYVGLASDGEVEDYQWGFGPTAVSLSSFSANNNAANSVGLVIVHESHPGGWQLHRHAPRRQGVPRKVTFELEIE